ncbi:MAG: tyrosine-type recombinase/integrase [Lachnospiraceae bacterium]|nr:tyrosine-type recombinase/integrase [Lachnospiraceae bacterium]
MDIAFLLIYMDGSRVVQQKSGFATEKEAGAARDRTIGELYSGTYIVYSNVTVKEYMEFWLIEDIGKRTESSDTYETFSLNVRNHIIPELGNKKMVDLNRGDIQKYYNKKAEYSIAVTRLSKTILNIAMRFAVDKKVIAENPAVGVGLPKKAKKSVVTEFHTRNIDTQKTLTMDQILVLLEASKDTPIHMQVCFNVLMGLRRCEINGVKYSDVDYINRTLKVQRQLGKKKGAKKEDYAPKTLTKQEIRLKTESSYRELPIPDYVFEAILEQRKQYEKQKNRRGEEFQDLDYICCSSYGRPRSKCYYWPYYKKLLKENDLPDIRWHDLRSTFCTLLLKNDFNPKAVSKLMGHAKEIITMDVYGDNQNIIADCVGEMQSFVDEVMPGKGEQENKEQQECDEIVIDIEEYLSA